MKRPKNPVVMLVGICVLAGMLYSGRLLWQADRMFSTGGLQDCSKDAISQVVSPDSKRTATIFQGSCGATTGVVTSLAVDEGEPSQPTRSYEVFRVTAAESFEVHWTDARTLVVACARPTDIRANRVQDIKLQYVGCG